MSDEQKNAENNMELKPKGINKKLLIGIACIIAIGVIVVLAIFLPRTATAKKVSKQLALGEKYLSELDYEQAIAAYELAVKIDPKNEDAYIGLAEVYIAMGDLDKAEEVLKDGKKQADDVKKIREKLKEVEKKKESQVTIPGVGDNAEPTQAPDAGDGTGSGTEPTGTPGSGTGTGDGTGNGTEPTGTPGTGDGTGSGSPTGSVAWNVSAEETTVRADSVSNEDGYGSLRIDGIRSEDGFEWDVLPEYALMDGHGRILIDYGRFPERIEPYGGVFANYDAEMDTSSPGSAGNGYTLYDLNGNPAIGEYYHRLSYYKGYAYVCKKFSKLQMPSGGENSNATGGIGGGPDEGEFSHQIIDKTGKVCMVLPDYFNEPLGMGFDGAKWVTDFMANVGGYGEGLFPFVYELPLKGNILNGEPQEWQADPDYDFWLDDRCGYIDMEGNVVIENRFEGCWPFVDGVAKVRGDDRRFGYIDKSGNWVIDCKYSDASNFLDGYAYVSEDGEKYGYIDTAGNIVIPLEYDNVLGNASGLFTVGRSIDGVMKYGAVDVNNSVVVPLEYDDLSTFEGGVMYGIKDGTVYILRVSKGTADLANHGKPEPVLPVFEIGEGGVIYRVYDENGNMVKECGGLAVAEDGTGWEIDSEYEYDTLGRRITQSYQLTRVENMNYRIVYSYDAAGNVTAEMVSSGTPLEVQAVSDKNGNIVSVKILSNGEWQEMENTEYDEEGRIVKKRINNNIINRETEYFYDNDGYVRSAENKLVWDGYVYTAKVRSMKLSEYLAMKGFTEKELAGTWQVCMEGNEEELLEITFGEDGTLTTTVTNATSGTADGSVEGKTETVEYVLEYKVNDGILEIGGFYYYFYTEADRMYLFHLGATPGGKREEEAGRPRD